MTPDELKKAVKEAVVEAHGELYIDPKQHYEDHGYIKGQRRAVKTVRTGTLYALGVAVFGFFVWVFQSIFNITPPTP